jgi:uncharacterized membrane protein
MTSLATHALTPRRPLRASLQNRQNALTFGLALAVYAALNYLILHYSENPPVHFRLDILPFMRSSFMLQAHVAGAFTALAIGVVLLLRVKGRTMHKILGYSWVVSMAATAVSSFFLTGLNGDKFSLIHLLSVWTVIALPMGIAAARSHDIKTHGKRMTGMFVRGMLVAGLFSFLPGRMMWSIFFGV